MPEIENVKDAVAVEFGRLLREQRGTRPRWRIAADSGLSPDTIGRWERGGGTPSLSDAFRLAAALGCRVSDLLPADELAAAKVPA